MVVVRLALRAALAVRAMALRHHAGVALHKAPVAIDKNVAKEALTVQGLTGSMTAMTGPMIPAMTGPKIAPMTAAWTGPTIAARAATSYHATSTLS